MPPRAFWQPKKRASEGVGGGGITALHPKREIMRIRPPTIVATEFGETSILDANVFPFLGFRLVVQPDRSPVVFFCKKTEGVQICSAAGGGYRPLLVATGHDIVLRLDKGGVSPFTQTPKHPSRRVPTIDGMTWSRLRCVAG